MVNTQGSLKARASFVPNRIEIPLAIYQATSDAKQ